MSHDIRMMVAELENNIISGLILVVLALMAFLGFRNSIFVAIAIPLSMLLAFSVIQAMGYSLNMMVLFSLNPGPGNAGGQRGRHRREHLQAS